MANTPSKSKKNNTVKKDPPTKVVVEPTPEKKVVAEKSVDPALIEKGKIAEVIATQKDKYKHKVVLAMSEVYDMLKPIEELIK